MNLKLEINKENEEKKQVDKIEKGKLPRKRNFTTAMESLNRLLDNKNFQ